MSWSFSFLSCSLYRLGLAAVFDWAGSATAFWRRGDFGFLGRWYFHVGDRLWIRSHRAQVTLVRHPMFPLMSVIPAPVNTRVGTMVKLRLLA